MYLGNPIPRYGLENLRLTVKNYGGPISLLTDVYQPETVGGVRFLDITSWYDKRPFERFKAQTNVDSLFRGGFWIHAIERFYVLEQYMKNLSIPRLFHAELDVLVLDLEGVSEDLDAHGLGVFIPPQVPGRAIGSLIYANSVRGLDDLTSFIDDNPYLGNEMKILGHYLGSGSHFAHGMVSDYSLSETKWPVTASSPGIKDYIVDSAGIGQWIFGYDRRNLIGTSWNHWKGGKLNYPVEQLKFSANFRGDKAAVKLDNRTFRLSVIHLHAKTFRRLRVPGVLAVYCWLSSRSWKVPISFQTGWLFESLGRAFFSKRATTSFIFKKRFSRKCMAPIVKAIAQAKPRVLSERERRFVNSFLVTPPPTVDVDPVDVVDPRDLHHLIPPDWTEILGSLSPGVKRKFLSNVAVFIDGIRATSPRIYSACNGREASQFRLDFGPRRGLVVTGLKNYLGTKQAVNHWWPEPLDTTWSFSEDFQIIDPDWVREMFPRGEDDIYRWFVSGVQHREPVVSAFQSFGIWAFSMKRRDVILFRNPNEPSVFLRTLS